MYHNKLTEKYQHLQYISLSESFFVLGDTGLRYKIPRMKTLKLINEGIFRGEVYSLLLLLNSSYSK